MTYEETFENVSKFLSSQQLGMFFGPKIPEIKEILQEVNKQINDLKNEKEVDGKELADKIRNLLNFFQILYLEVPVTKDIPFWMNDFTTIILNWNENTCKDQYIDLKCRFINRAYFMALTTLELFELSRQLAEKIRSVMGYALPSVELSRHYLDCLKEEKNPE